MSRSLLIVLIFLLSTYGTSFAMYIENSLPQVQPKFIPNEIIVKFKNDKISVSSVVKKYSLDIQEISSNKASPFSGVYKIKIKENNQASILSTFASDPDVLYAEPNGLMSVCVTPNDPYYSNQWAFSKIVAEKGWDAATGEKDVVIAVIDTGVDYSHPDLSQNIWINEKEIPGNGIDDDSNGYVDDIRGWNFVSVSESWLGEGETTGPNNNPMDHLGHGTHVAGIACGATNNGIGAAGTSWNSKIMVLRAGYKASDGNGYLEFYDVANAIVYAADNGADIINMSFGSIYDSSIMRDAVNYAVSKGVLLVAAAGNVTSEYAKAPFYPAAYDSVIAVAATDQKDKLCIFNWTTFSNFGTFVDVTAPGINIFSTLPSGRYGYLSGTSMATPFVSGLAALIKSYNPEFTASMIEAKIKGAADNIDSVNQDFFRGYLGVGRINAFSCLGKLDIDITYPRQGSKVSGGVLILGSAGKEDFQSYEIDYRKKGDTVFIPVSERRTISVREGELGVWSTGSLNGDYELRLTLYDTGGRAYSKSVDVSIGEGGEVILLQPTLSGPNPFNPASGNAVIYYYIGSTTAVDILIYDITGTLIKRITNFSSPGTNKVEWNGITAFGYMAPSGVYPYILIANDRGTRKIIGRSKIAVIRN